MGLLLSTAAIKNTFYFSTFFDRSINHLYDSRPMSGALPIVIDPLDLAKSGSRLVGQFRLSEMPRLRPFSPSDSAVAEVDLGFAQSDPDVARLTGHIKVSLQLTCQRCLQPMVLSLDLEPEIYFDGSGTAADELDNRDLINLADGRPARAATRQSRTGR
jgi:hypothetical protein